MVQNITHLNFLGQDPMQHLKQHAIRAHCERDVLVVVPGRGGPGEDVRDLVHHFLCERKFIDKDT